ncbi:hypothetical protein ACSU1N_05820 [Thermogladius sp. 4427co]|uniref:hypothetical protein n=1 Tax=Thermogladius sp. 4427co TaxID=3450718 RepID=UPI003F7A34D4
MTGRLVEELGADGFIFVTRWEVANIVEESLQHVQKEISLKYIGDYKLGKSLLKEDLFENAFLFKNLLEKALETGKKRIVLDLTMTTGELASAAHFALKNLNSDSMDIIVSVVGTIPLQGIPAYPGNPRWLHKVYIYTRNSIDYKGVEVVSSPPKLIEWKGTRGVYIAVAKLFNSLTERKIVEVFDGRRKEIPNREEDVLDIFIYDTYNDEKKKILSIESEKGPSEDVTRLMYNSWKTVYETVSATLQDNNEAKSVERILRQLQRLTGAADLIVSDIVSQDLDLDRFKKAKLHALIRMLREEFNNLAIIPDTNMLYQGLHMSLLKASIRNNSPWSPITNVDVYIPVCAEAEINGKIASTSSASQSLVEKLSYIMALMANRIIQEIKYHYKAQSIPAISQPCESSIAVEALNLSNRVVLLLTADKKAFNAWQTFNACRGNVVCVYVSHDDNPLNANSLYSKFYASVVLANIVFIYSLFTRVLIKSRKGSVVTYANKLRGASAPSISISREVKN